MNDSNMQGAIESISIPNYLSSRSEIVQHYQDTYGPDWKSHIVSDLVVQTGKSRATVAREFQYDKRAGQERYKSERVSRATAEKYQQLGTTLPIQSRTPKADSITITVTGKQNNGRGGYRNRNISVTFSGIEAYDFVNNPSYEAFYEAYGVDADEFMDGEYEIVVETVLAA